MKHAVIVKADDRRKPYTEIESADGQRLYLTEEYTQEELDEFGSEKPKWIIRCQGTRFFLADSDSGEDAEGYYCGYFDLDPERAVFENGRFTGIYLITDGFQYSGRGRYNYSIDKWGYPGYDLFGFAARGSKAHVFLFSDPDTHQWGDWSLLERDPEKEYTSYLDF